jgi:DNA-binding transcriptional ArsR family regulator
MTKRRSDILLHPIRLRIVLMVSNDELTTTNIAKRLPEVPQATLYRHIAKLVEAGMLEIASQRQARGAMERTYRVNTSHAGLSTDEVENMSPEEHLQAFMVFTGILIDTYGRYLATPNPNPAADGVSFRQARLWLTDGELQSLVTDVAEALAPYVDLKTSPTRKPRLLSTILMPEPVSTHD